jgi:hypothetical protein
MEVDCRVVWQGTREFRTVRRADDQSYRAGGPIMQTAPRLLRAFAVKKRTDRNPPNPVVRRRLMGSPEADVPRFGIGP